MNGNRSYYLKSGLIPLTLFILLFSFSFVSAGFSSDLAHYYKFDETSGSVLIDSAGAYNGTIGTNVILNKTGIINGSQQSFDNGTTTNISIASIGTTFSESFWIFSNLNATFNTTTTHDSNWSVIQTNNAFPTTAYNHIDINSIIPNAWNNVIITIEPSHIVGYASRISVYVNGVLDQQSDYWFCRPTPSTSIKSYNFYMYYINGLYRIYSDPCNAQGSQNLSFNSYNNFGTDFTDKYVKVDEVGAWNNYVLTQADVDYLYGSGTPPDYTTITTDPPSIMTNFSNRTLSDGSAVTYSINAYYSNFDYFNITWFDETSNTTQTLTKFINETGSSIIGDANVTLDGLLNTNDITFKIVGVNQNHVINFTARAYNVNGYAEQNFTMTTIFVSQDQSGYLGNIADFFAGLFPDAENLTSTQRYSFVLITLAVITGLILFLGKSDVEVAMKLALVLDIITFGYFAVIGYISTGIIILLVLISLIIFSVKSMIGNR